MKISIVEPKTPFYNFYSAVVKHLPLLGPIYLGTILKNEGHDVTVYNENIKDIDYSRFKDSDVLGISMITSTAPRGYEIAEKFRQLNPRGRVIIGGSHATFLAEEAAQFADHVVTGEAESVICDLVRAGGDKIISGSPVWTLVRNACRSPRFLHPGVAPLTAPSAPSPLCSAGNTATAPRRA